MARSNVVATIVVAIVLIGGCDFLDGENGANFSENSEPLEGGWVGMELILPEGVAAHEVRITGIHCESAAECAVSVESGHGFIAGASTSGVSGVVLDGAVVAQAGSGTADMDFTGFNKTSLGVVARMGLSNYFVLADGNLTDPASWSFQSMGTNESDNDFQVLNTQWLIADDGSGNWIFNYNGVIWGTDSNPSPTTFWNGLWSPNRNPPFPSDFLDRKSADDSICDSSPEMNVSPTATQFNYAAPDFSVIIYPANTINQGGSDPTGVCVSTDGAQNFRHVPFPDATNEDHEGPKAVYCIDKDRCWAYNGRQFATDSVYVYYTTNASQGTSMTWTRAQLPSLPDVGVVPRHIFFAPDGQHGWLVGQLTSSSPLMLYTDDGGQSWENISGGVQAAVGGVRLHSGFAIDANRIFVGGESATLYYHASGGME
jgi:hypothetical protein